MAVPNLWRTQKQRYSLQGETCLACTEVIFPPREVCPHCGRSLHIKPNTPWQNAIYGFTVMLMPAQVEAPTAGDD